MTEKPIFPGYGSPVVFIFDHKMDILLDLFVGASGPQNLALQKFSYEFKEKEEDKCTITFDSNHVDLMDNLNFVLGQTLLVSWGYLNGDMCLPIKCVLVDTKETFNTQGYSITLELSDNFSVLNKAVNPSVVQLQVGIDALKKAQEDGEDDLGDLFFKKTQEWLYSKYGRDDYNIKSLGGELVKREVYSRTVNLRDKKFGDGSTGERELAREHALSQLKLRAESRNLSPGVLNWVLQVIGNDPNFDWAKTLEEDDYLVDEHADPSSTQNTPELITVIGGNSKQVMQETVNKVSVTPKQVTGRNGKALTYNKRRAMNMPAITSFTFKQEDGRLLEFTYDTNAKYSKDESVLQQFTIDPKTGTITRKDYLKDNETLKDDSSNPTQEFQTRVDRSAMELIKKTALAGGDVKELISTNSSARYTGESSTGEIVPVWDYGSNDFRRAAMVVDQGQFQELYPAVDNTAWNHAIVVIPAELIDPAKKELENELKSYKQADGEKVKATAKVLGDPQLTSGVNVDILGVGKKRSGKYFLTGCIHTIAPGSGFICTLEGFLVRLQPKDIVVISTGVNKDTLKEKAETIKTKKIKVNPNMAAIKARGYYLSTDFERSDIEQKLFDKEGEWGEKILGQFYRIRLQHPTTHQWVNYIIKVPIDPVTGTYQYPFNVFGRDLFYKLLGIEASNQLQTFEGATITPLYSKMQIKEDPIYQGPTEEDWKAK